MPLNVEQQEEYLYLLSQGASPAGACGKLGLPIVAVLHAIEADAQFRQRLDQIHELLSQNVATALYRAAMEGNVSAQTFYLRNQPPPHWVTPDDSSLPTDDLDRLTDEELDTLLQKEGFPLPSEAEVGVDETPSAASS